MKEVLENIKEIRKKMGYSQEYMAHMLDLSQVAYTKLESNQTKLTLERLFKIAEILDVELCELLNLEQKHQIYPAKVDSTNDYLQQIERCIQENKVVYEKLIQTKDEQIALLKDLLLKTYV